MNWKTIAVIAAVVLGAVFLSNALAENRDKHNRCMQRNSGFGESLSGMICD